MKFIIGEPGGPSGPFYSVVSQTGEVVAMQITREYFAKIIQRAMQAESGDDDFLEQLVERFYVIVERDFPNNYKPIDSGSYNYVIRAVCEAIFHEYSHGGER